MKTKKEILKEIKPILNLEFYNYKKEITKDITFKELGANNIKIKELLMQLEELYQIKFRDDLEMKKIDDFLKYLIIVL